MATVDLVCPHCGKELEAPGERRGETCACPACSGTVKVPSAPAAEAPPRPPPVPVAPSTAAERAGPALPIAFGLLLLGGLIVAAVLLVARQL